MHMVEAAEAISIRQEVGRAIEVDLVREQRRPLKKTARERTPKTNSQGGSQLRHCAGTIGTKRAKGKRSERQREKWREEEEGKEVEEKEEEDKVQGDGAVEEVQGAD